MASEVLDIVIVGAGLSGISAARFYLDVHPESNVVVLEKDTSIGGPWGKSRMYPGFWSQSGIRMSGFSDVPFSVPKDAEVCNDIYEAKYVSDYLENYVDSHVYAEKPLRDRIRLDFAVGRITKALDIWIVEGEQDGASRSFKTKRLIVATGITSEPKMPILAGSSTFGGQILHQNDYGTFMTQPSSIAQKVAVIGAGKSAADAVYGLVKAGHEVHWIIRKSGDGPGAFTNPADNAKGPFLNDPELAATRMFATMSPGCFTQPNAWTRFLHGTSLGDKVLEGVFNGADEKCKKIGNFHGRPGALDGFEDLESNVKLFWVTGQFGLIQRPDFWDTVAPNVRVHSHDIARLENHKVVLKDGPSLPMDVIVCATGFRNDFSFFSAEQRIQLGLPHLRADDEAEASWRTLEATADKEVLQKYPKLATPPPVSLAPDSPSLNRITPNRLYNCILPITDHSIAFHGNIYGPNGFRIAEVQAIWTTALFDGIVQLPGKQAMQQDIAWVNAFNRRRYPTKGALGNFFHYDMMGYLDRLLGQVGLTSYRKGWWADLMYPLIASDLQGTTGEYLRKYRAKMEGERTDRALGVGGG
ncbi:hypothetical protein BDV95DRAFT_577622 [Massariosphaeria phaeospora]|uniref:Dimethylaniline monooxygenase n=1 Tax=Massariosphaeria phaeospora TaxID=100035 RepID=A0A7C8M3X0_9PLEO|nr:hypothetical protein BDV95DRAFT_577622 [Massariosphaeria phaeospora]